MRWRALLCSLLLSLTGQAKSEQLPEMRPALVGSGPRSLINMINAERLMKQGQKDAMVMFNCLVAPNGWGGDMILYRGTNHSEHLAEEVSDAVTNVVFIPAVYNHQKRWAWVTGTVLYRIIDGKPHVRIYLNQEGDRIVHGDDFIAPQPVWIADKDMDVRRWHLYPMEGYSATVVIRLSLDAAGKYRDAKLVFETPQGKGFGSQWLSQIREWTFLPGYLNGKPTACTANYEIVGKSAGKHWQHWKPD